MNAQAQMSGQVPGRVQNQANQQMGGLQQPRGYGLPTQWQTLASHGMDREVEASRENVRNGLIQLLQRRSTEPHPDWLHKVPALAKRLEDQLFRHASSKEDYMSMGMTTIEQRLQSILRNANSQSLSHQTPSSSLVSTMIPTPGMQHNANTISADNPMTASGGSGIVAQNTISSGNLLPIANGSAGVGHNSSFNASDGSVSNRYQQSSINLAHGSGGNSVLSSRQLSQMIPTPGLNNLQQIPLITESTHGGGFTRIDSTMVSQQQQQQQQQHLQAHQHQLRQLQQQHQQQQQKQFVGSQNSRILHALGGQIGGGQRPSPYGFSNRVLNGSIGMIGSSPNPIQQFDQQQNSSGIPTSLSHQMLPIVGDGFGMKTDLSVSENLYGPASSVVSSMNSQTMNPMSLHSASKSNHALLAHNTVLQPLQQPPLVKSEYDHSQKMNFQAPQSREQLLQSHPELQNFQQQSNQPYGQLVQQQHRQREQNSQQQQLLSKNDHLRQSMIASNFGGPPLSEHGIEPHNESLFTQTAEHFNLQELQSQYQQNTAIGNHSRDTQLLDRLASPRDFQPGFSQGSQQTMQAHQQTTASQNDYSSLLSVPQADTPHQSHWHPQPAQKTQISEKSSSEQQIQEFQQRITGWEEAQQPRFDNCITGHAITQGVPAPQSSNGVACGLRNSMPETNNRKQTRWLLFMYHARRCTAPKGECKDVHCIEVQRLVKHIDNCHSNECGTPRCRQSKKMIEHYRNCRAADCPVCRPVSEIISSSRKAVSRLAADGLVNKKSDSWRSLNAIGEDNVITKTVAPSYETSDDLQSLKRPKLQHSYPSLVPKKESPVPVPVVSQPHISQDAHPQRTDITISSKSEAVEVPTNSSLGLAQGDITMFDNIVDQSLHMASLESESFAPNDVVGHVNEETMLVETEDDQVKVEVKHEVNGPADSLIGSKSGKPKIKGVSLTELFTPEQIKEHIRSLRQWVGQSKAKAEKNQAHLMSENSCQLCAVEKLTFEPPPIYCTPCGVRIKRNASYYTMGTGDTRHYFCVACYNDARGETINIEGNPFPKLKLEKKKNDEETEEWWVQCDKCEAWQHQICALFNGRRNDGGQAEYTCPNCYIEEIKQGERKPLPQSAVLGAKDLPKTILSDHIEQRLFKRLKQERQDRARQAGKSFDEVPGADALVVRVVSSVDKKLEVKQHFLEMFQEENYPTEFPYKSKVVLLFQKIEGVEVCLFGMYVQEFGSECQFPNQRRVYLSYLDSVKYFRPDVRTVSGEALRTFVYHEILIGYLEYCKKRGFTSCYIWACPPLKGEDYILYCHPEIQKTPKSDKLREWYLAMLRKACKENIVVDLINLYDHFFTSVGECKAKVTAARLPYFDGDYWPGAAEDMINQLRQEEDGKKQQKKGKTKKTLTKRGQKAAGHTDLTGNASKDALLMQKLGETICPMKEDFIMVHLQHACNHCCALMVSGTRWVCNHCKNFQLCDKCNDAERKLEERERHPVNSREKHLFRPVEITDVSLDTKDNDDILESEFFDTRQAFLSLCQGNHYQYDTLRRAKHSSMMVLYHLHNPTAPAFVTTCNTCHHDIETGQGWRCEICPDFDVCNACYQKDGGVDHPHKLTNHPSIAERDAQNQEAREKRVLQLRKMLDLLVHASQCRFPHCQYPNCRKVKGLFRHGIQCKTRASGGCPLCKKMWYLLQLHARACKVSGCHVPRCRDLKEHLKRLQQQSDSRRRAAVMEMMRQRAAEVAGSNE